MYEKIALSINKLQQFNIHIIGQNISYKNIPEGITLHPIFRFSRLSLLRIQAPLLFFIQLIRLRPVLNIISTHELLFPSAIYKLIFGGRLIYDVRENYHKNIINTNAFPQIIRGPVAVYVRTKEWVTSPFVDHFFLAERSYADELTFIKDKFTILENKYQGSIKAEVKINKGLNLLYSGTIAENYGIWEAIELASKLYQANSQTTLKIIGYSADSELFENLSKSISTKKFITLIGGDKLVPHEEIIEAVQQADFGLIAYQPNPSTDNCIPTKLYEYFINRLPVILTPNPLWIDFSAAYNAAVVIDYKSYDATTLISQMKQTIFFDKGDFNKLLWIDEEKKLFSIISGLNIKA